MYAKLVDDKLVQAPGKIICDIEVNGQVKPFQVFNPTAEQYAKAGYLPVKKPSPPKEDGYYTLVYTERDGAIYGEWVESDAPVIETTPTLEERTTKLEGEVAGLSEELEAAKILLGVDE